MWFMYALAIASSAMMLWTVFGQYAPQEVQHEVTNFQSVVKQVVVTAVEMVEPHDPAVGGGDDRTANMKFVKAIKGSIIWTDVRRRSLTIKTRPELVGQEDKSPEDLSDQDLSKLKRAYHDALKCVAVDQLMVLKSVTGFTDAGTKVTAVRMAIVKITKVITNYTTEYHEDVYRYEEVTETDDAEKVSSSVTAIVEDNWELCLPPRTDTSASVEGASGPGTNDVAGPEGNSGAKGPEGNGSTTSTKGTDGQSTGNAGQDTTTNVNTGRQNFGTINNYNWNYGTVNDATVHASGNGKRGGGQAEKGITDGGHGNDTTKEPEEAGKSSAGVTRYGRPDDGGAPDLGFIFSNGESGAKAVNHGDDGPRDGGRNGKRSAGRRRSSSVDAVGPSDAAAVKTGTVDQEYLNNGRMNVYNVNRGMVNKGSLSRTNAEGGIVSVGTVNNGTNTSYVNNGVGSTTADDHVNVLRFATSVDRAYTDILRRLVAQ